MSAVIKKNKIWYYILGYTRRFFIKKVAEKEIGKLLKQITEEELIEINNRVNYYNKLNGNGKVKINSDSIHSIKDLKHPTTPKAYFFDTYEYARYFSENQKINFIFGDVTTVPDSPGIVKSRPIGNDNENSIVLNLDKVRHFVKVNDDKNFLDKKDMLIGRGAIFGNQKNRIAFFKKYFNHPLCNLGQTNNYLGNIWKKPKISIEKHLDYKFILSLQGNDVATNLKWIMSSNSIAVMPKPTMETWYMEGKLIPGVHYVEIKDDFSDVEEKLIYYINHPNECLEIIKNAKKYRETFNNPTIEKLTSLLVLKKYFDSVIN